MCSWCGIRARHVEDVRAIMRCGALTSAARLLNVPQPALSQSRLQAGDEPGLRLFERVKGRLVPRGRPHATVPLRGRGHGVLRATRALPVSRLTSVRRLFSHHRARLREDLRRRRPARPETGRPMSSVHASAPAREAARRSLAPGFDARNPTP
ncbi:LysR family transcriptional regulator [Methylobacterium sp. JK268]